MGSLRSTGFARPVTTAYGQQQRRRAATNVSVAGSPVMAANGSEEGLFPATSDARAASHVAESPAPVRERQTVPEAWPTLLNREQLCAYVSMPWSTISKVCPVAPVDLGLNVLRYSRQKIDEWVSNLPPRLERSGSRDRPGVLKVEAAEVEVVADQRMDALDRARESLAKR